MEALTQRHKRLSSATDIQFVIGSHAETLDEQLLPQLSRIHADLNDIDDAHAALVAARQHMEAGRIEAEEGLSALRAYFEAVPVDPAALKDVEERLDAIHDAARKHRVSAKDLALHLKEVAAELDSLEVDEARLESLREVCEASEGKYRSAGARLTEARAGAARSFEKAVRAALAELGFGQASLSVQFTPVENERGLETVDFLFAASPQYPAGFLKSIASGGELARISLAICVVAATRSDLPCLVLDEADVGIGGTTADGARAHVATPGETYAGHLRHPTRPRWLPSGMRISGSEKLRAMTRSSKRSTRTNASMNSRACWLDNGSRVRRGSTPKRSSRAETSPEAASPGGMRTDVRRQKNRRPMGFCR